MPRPRFQFRLWTTFAVTALVGWGIVALPYWVHTYPKDQRAQEDQIQLMGLSASERYKELYDRHYDEPMTRFDFSAKPLVVGLISVAALAAGLACLRYVRGRKSR